KEFGTHEDTDKDHACDYGCSETIGDCVDTNHDHKCDHGCGKEFGTHEDTDKNHDCDYGCSETIGDCVDTNNDFMCDYGCGKIYNNHTDENKDHVCDCGCSETIGTCEDKDLDHKCDYGCDKVYGTHTDSASDNDHVCDYGCGETIEACTDGDDNNHNCDICDKENITDHDWTDASCTVAKTCSVCGEVDGEPLGHTGGEPTCTISAICDVCGEEYLDKDNHLEFEWKDVPPSCTLNGYSAEHCIACNYFKTESMIPGDDATGHSFGDAETVPPTCTEPGYDIRVCSTCEADEKSNYKPATDHSYDWTVTKPATCEETGLRDGECSVCHDVIEDEVINRTECKEFETQLIVKSSNEHNIEIVKCTVCEKEQSRTEMHKTRAQTVSRLSCTENWVIRETCSVCSEYSREYVREYTTGHEATKNVAESSDPTCTTSGLLVFSGNCTKCGESFERSEIFLPAKGHSKKEGTMQTCTTSEICKDCGEDIPGKEALGHDFDIFAAAFNAHMDNFFCNRCGGTHENTLDVFNTLANRIKDTDKYYVNTRGEQLITMNKTSTAMTYSRFDFGMFTDSFKEEFDNMANEPDKYSRITTTGRVSYTLPIQNSVFVSRLEKQDIEGITVNQLNGINIGEVLSGFNPTYTNQQQIELIEKYKNTSISGDILKVTININNEKYTEVKKLPQNTRTALSNIYKYDIISSAQLALNDFKGNNDLGADGIEFTVDLKEFSTDARVTYYFKADTFDPIIALYDIDERAEIKADITIPLGLINFNGGFDPDIKMTTTTVYLFPHLFN
ncbi:MAG: hypothetical protein IKL10_04090, partial [Clostridia bacterium]|nr:hypothetical protein [Clostridia bacterium]